MKDPFRIASAEAGYLVNKKKVC